MPVIMRYRGFRFFFYSNEGRPLEPAHIHVRKAGEEAKFWLAPEVQLARNDGFGAKTLRELSEFIRQNKQELEEAWNDYFT